MTLRAPKLLLASTVAAGVALAASPALADTTRILVSIGQNVGLAAEQPLKYADQDAVRVRDVLVSLGGVRPENAFVLTGATRAQLLATLDRVKAANAAKKPDEVTLLFYFSGHGDREALHLKDDRVSLAELQSKLAEIPASLRLSVTDACRTNREKGFLADEPFAITATSTTQAIGQVWLHASSDGEAAQESDELQGAVFTHTWLSGLRGAADANGDARVTLDESFAFAHSQTLIRSAKSSGVLQKPEAVVTLRELSPVVITQTATKTGRLSLPLTRDAHYLVYAAGAKSVLSSMWGSPERRIALAVPPGRYVVLRRLAGRTYSTSMNVAEGERRELEERDFAPEGLMTVARKGDDGSDPDVIRRPSPRRTPNELAVAWDLGADARTGGFAQGPRAGYTYAWRSVAIGLGGGATFAGRTLATSEEQLVTGYGRVSAELRHPVGSTLLRAGGGARVGWIFQDVTARASSSGASSSSSSSAFAVGPEIFVGARRDLGASFFAEASVSGLLLGFREDGEARFVPSLLGSLGAGAAF